MSGTFVHESISLEYDVIYALTSRFLTGSTRFKHARNSSDDLPRSYRQSEQGSCQLGVQTPRDEATFGSQSPIHTSRGYGVCHIHKVSFLFPFRNLSACRSMFSLKRSLGLKMNAQWGCFTL